MPGEPTPRILRGILSSQLPMWAKWCISFAWDMIRDGSLGQQKKWWCFYCLFMRVTSTDKHWKNWVGWHFFFFGFSQMRVTPGAFPCKQFAKGGGIAFPGPETTDQWIGESEKTMSSNVMLHSAQFGNHSASLLLLKIAWGAFIAFWLAKWGRELLWQAIWSNEAAA